MIFKAYVVLRELEEGGDDLIALRLTRGAADAVAEMNPGSRVEPWDVTKSAELTPKEVTRLEDRRRVG